MPRLIDTQANELDNTWQLLPRETTLDEALATPAAQLLVNVELWLEQRAALTAAGKTVAPWLDGDQDADLLTGMTDAMPLIALNFPRFMDGRSYSTAFRLRQHHRYQGELRAIGDVLRDQLFYMRRCGFTTFDLADSVKLEDARSAFGDFTTNYQSTVEEPQPLFRRRD